MQQWNDMLTLDFSSAFLRDIKRLKRKHIDQQPLEEVIDLIRLNTPKSLAELKRRHNMRSLSGSWLGSFECHVCNAGDWLIIWATNGQTAFLQRKGTHDELFR